MSKPLVSVFMVTYNHGNYISQAIKSVLIQLTSFPVKLYIGEDCSVDNTGKIIDEFRMNYPDKIEVIHNNKNLGAIENAYQVYNACLKSGSRYIAILEGDDYWLDPNKLQLQVEYLEKNQDAVLCFSNSLIINEKEEIINYSRVPDKYKKTLTQREILSGYCPPANTVMFRRDVLSQGIPAEYLRSLNGDYFLFTLLTENGTAGYIDRITSVYRVHNEGIWSQKPKEYLTENYIKTCRAISKVINKNKDVIEQSIMNSYDQLLELGRTEEFLDNGFWTPQSKMLQSIRDDVFRINANCTNALSIDDNPTLEKILKWKWPELEVSKAVYPQDDVMDLQRFSDNSFDIVFSHQVLEHVPKPWIAAKEIVRVLKRGGIGVHTTCAFNPRHGQPQFSDYYRFLPEGLVELFDGVNVWVKGEWGSRQAILYNVGINDGYGDLGGRRFNKTIGQESDGLYPWHTWIIFQKK